MSATGPAPLLGDAVAADAAGLRRLERRENFPVALRVLPARVRTDLRLVYDVARTIDDIGDDPLVEPADRLRRLDLLAGQLPAVAAGRGLPVQPFLDLVEANRRDQTTSRYLTYDDLLRSCVLSANPVGRLVLAVFGVDTAEAARRSDDVCTALQLVEHCQDVAEDLRDRDRVYLPLADLERFGADERDLTAVPTPGAVRRVVALQVDRAVELLVSGPVLVGLLSGWARIAVAGYVAGGLATVEAIRRADHDVLTASPKPRRRDVARHAGRLLRSGR